MSVIPVRRIPAHLIVCLFLISATSAVHLSLKKNVCVSCDELHVILVMMQLPVFVYRLKAVNLGPHMSLEPRSPSASASKSLMLFVGEEKQKHKRNSLILACILTFPY